MLTWNMWRTIEVTDDWYPCMDGNRITLHLFMSRLAGDRNYRVKLIAYGGDDYDLELFYKYRNRREADKKFRELKKLFQSVPDGVDKKWFWDRGFR